MSRESAIAPPERVLAEAAREAVRLLPALVRFNTTISEADDPAIDDLAHQEFIAGYLRDLGLEIEMFEPRPEDLDGHRLYRGEHNFRDRPIIWGRLSGEGKGRSLLFNGHFDTVPADPVHLWTHSPWSGDLVDGRIYGRGACDMKGGIAAALGAIHAIAHEGKRLGGDLFVNVAPFEEVSGIGTLATMISGYRADAAVCCEPSELNVIVADRGILIGQLSTVGRSAHAEVGQPHHSVGGAVSAIDKLVDLLHQLRRLNEDWRLRPDKQHGLLTTPYVLCTVIEGGSFASNWPAVAKASLNVCYLPLEADDDGYGGHVKAEIEQFVAAYAATDPWLRLHPPEIAWEADFPPAELDPHHRLVEAITATVSAEGVRGSRVVGYDTWADNATLIREGHIPTVCFGPGSILNAHTVDESVSVAELEACARIYTHLAFRWTNAASRSPDR
jgi:acetylornithine deacetylase